MSYQRPVDGVNTAYEAPGQTDQATTISSNPLDPLKKFSSEHWYFEEAIIEPPKRQKPKDIQCINFENARYVEEMFDILVGCSQLSTIIPHDSPYCDVFTVKLGHQSSKLLRC